MTATATTECLAAKPPADRLQNLADQTQEVFARIDQCKRTTLELARDAGIYLNRAHELVAKGGWGNWCKSNFPGRKKVTISVYRNIASNWDSVKDCGTVADAREVIASLKANGTTTNGTKKVLTVKLKNTELVLIKNSLSKLGKIYGNKRKAGILIHALHDALELHRELTIKE